MDYGRKKMDRRQRKTRNAIFESFSSLLERKHYSSITIQNIIDEADIGRSTFYAHFNTKDELLKEMCTEIFEHVFSSDVTSEKKHDFSHDKTFFARLTHILYHLQEKQQHIRGLLKGECGEVFMRNLTTQLSEIFKSRITSDKSIPQSFSLDFTVRSFAETIRWWLQEHDEYTPEQIVKFFSGCINTFGIGE